MYADIYIQKVWLWTLLIFVRLDQTKN
jgi:hypothetical protein